MNRRHTLRHAAACAAGALLAVAGTLAVSGPVAAEPPAEPPEITIAGACAWDPDGQEWVVSWTVEATAPAPLLVEAAPAAHPVAGLPDPVQASPGEPLTGTQRLPGDTPAASLTVTVTGDDAAVPVLAALALPADCDGPPGAALAGWSVDCSGLLITVENPADEEVTLTFSASTGSAHQVAVVAGESATVEFPATAGLSVDILFQGWSILDPAAPIEVTAAELAALSCEDEANGAGGGLPATGFPLGLTLLGAAALLALGTGLFVLARRRRIRFTV